jgi:hypothetical protein
MASDVDICNIALNALGASNIISLTEDSKAARLCNQRYTFVRDSVFRNHPWNCLIQRVGLARDLETTAYEFSFQYTLPSNPFCLRVLDVENEELGSIVYVIEGRKLLTDEGSINLRYVGLVTDPNQYDALLVETIAAALASELAYPIANSNSLQAQLYELYLEKLRAARYVDATEGIADTILATDFTDARL